MPSPLATALLVFALVLAIVGIPVAAIIVGAVAVAWEAVLMIGSGFSAR